MAPTTRSKRKRQEAELELRLRAIDGNFDRARELVEIERVNVDCANEHGETPLMFAVINGHFIIARLLLENRADVDAANNGGWTALVWAVFKGNVAVAEILLEHGANINKEFRYFDGCMYSPLGFAIYKRSVAMVALLLRFGANTEETLYLDETYTALYLACWKSNVGVVQLLLDHDDGVDVNAFQPSENDANLAMSPLCMACSRQNNNMEIAQLLIQHGARVIFEGVYPHVPAPLVHAVKKGSLELVQYLLDNTEEFANDELAPRPEVVEMNHPLSPALDAAIAYNKLQAAQLLVDRGANVNDCAFRFLWRCATMLQQRHELARLLLRAGANVNLADHESGQTPLWAAAENGDGQLVKEFLKAHADVRIRDNNGDKPLEVARRNGHKGVVYLLLRTSPHVWPKLQSFVSGVSH